MEMPLIIKGFIYKNTHSEKLEFYTSDALNGVSNLRVIRPYEIEVKVDIPEGEEMRLLQEAKKQKLLETKRNMECHLSHISKQLEEFDHEHK